MSIKVLAVLLHVISSGIALVTSETQTRRIIRATKKYEMISLGIKGVGLIIAGGGTLIILKKLANGLKVIKDNNFLLRNKI